MESTDGKPQPQRFSSPTPPRARRERLAVSPEKFSDCLSNRLAHRVYALLQLENFLHAVAPVPLSLFRCFEMKCSYVSFVGLDLLTVCPKYHRFSGQLRARLDKLESAGELPKRNCMNWNRISRTGMNWNRISRTVGAYGEAYFQFKLACQGWLVDAIGATANGIDLLAWREGGPNMGINVKTRIAEWRSSVTLFKSDAHVDAMIRECKLRGVEPYIACVVFTDDGIRGHLMSLATFMARYRRRPRPGTKTIKFYRTSADEEKYELDPDVMKLHGEDVEAGLVLEAEDAPRPAPRPARLRTKQNTAR